MPDPSPKTGDRQPPADRLTRTVQPRPAALSGLFLCLLVAGCTGSLGDDNLTAEASPAVEAAPTVEARSAADVPRCEDLPYALLPATPTRDFLLGRFGPADRLEVALEPNRHVVGVTDSLFVVRYPGLAVYITKPGTRPVDMVTDVFVEDNSYLLHPEIGIGAHRDSVMALLGPPTNQEPDILTYDCGEGASQPVHFQLRDARVWRIVIKYYLG